MIMAAENNGYLGERRIEVGRAGSLRFSPTSQKLQAVGQRILSSPKIVEVEENVFSTCQVPLEDLYDRFLDARPFGAPLVEVTVFPSKDQYAATEQHIGGGSRVVEDVTWSDGKQRRNRDYGYHMLYDRMALDLDYLNLGEDRNILSYFGPAREVQSYFTTGFYRIDWGRAYELGKSRENEIIHGFMPTDDPRLDEQLDHALEQLERFEIAAKTPDGYWK